MRVEEGEAGNEATCFAHQNAVYTVEPLIMDTPKSGQPPYNGHTVHPLPIYCPYISTSKKGTTSEQWTKFSSPTCPLFGGSTVITFCYFTFVVFPVFLYPEGHHLYSQHKYILSRHLHYFTSLNFCLVFVVLCIIAFFL